MYYIGLDVHKKMISYCVKDRSGKVHSEGRIPATRYDLDCMKNLPRPWSAAMEATMFTGWIYDHLKPHAAEEPTPTRFATVCDVIFCRSATWPRRPFANGGERCAIATCWCGRCADENQNQLAADGSGREL